MKSKISTSISVRKTGVDGPYGINGGATLRRTGAACVALAVLLSGSVAQAATEVHSVAELVAAVTSASAGETIRLMKDGSPYVFSNSSVGMGNGGYQSKTPFLLIINKNLVIEGEDGSPRSTWTDKAEPVVIDGNGVGGFAHVASGSTALFRNIAFTRGTVAANYTAPIYSAKSAVADSNADVVCSNCVFRQNSGSGSSYSGAFCTALYDCLVTNNTACALRACHIVGCDIVDSAVTPISLSSAYSSTFRAIRAGQLCGTDLGTVSNCTIEANAFSYYIANAGVFIDCTMRGNTITGGDSYTSLVGGGMTVRGCTFEGNSLGWTKSILPASYSCTNCTFQGNTCKYVAYNPTSLTGCRFEDNLGLGGGAAVYIDGAISVNLDGCTFLRNKSNYASGFGAAIYMKRTASALCGLVATNCVFEGNNANTGGTGGAIYNDDSALPSGENPWDSCLVQDCTFTTNAAAAVAGVYGVKAVGCTFDRNFRYRPAEGNVTANAARKSYLVDCDINDGELCQCIVDRCRIHDIENGAASWLFNGWTRCTNSLVVNCTLTSGGALHRMPYGAMDAEFVNCTIVSNVMYTYTPQNNCSATNGILFANCLFSGNKTYYRWTDLDVCTSYLSTDANAAQRMGEYVTFSKTFMGNVNPSVGGKQFAAEEVYAFTNAPGTLAVCENPKFAGRSATLMRRYPYEPYFALSYNSPLAGAGTVAGWMSDAADLAGRPRLRDGKVDVGCYQCWLNPSGIVMTVW